MSFIGKAVGTTVKTAIKVAVVAPFAWVAYSKFGIDHDVELPDAIDARRRTMRTAAAGALSYYADESGSGRPLVLIHSVNAAANPREMQPLFDHYRGSRPVYAIDLPGFGFSERADRDYSAQMFADAIGEFLIHGVDQPPDVVALSLSCEFTAIAASVNPDTVHSLTFISPTGLAVDHDEHDSPEVKITPTGTKVSLGLARLRGKVRPEHVHKALANPLWAQPLYDLVVSKPSLSYFSPRADHSLKTLTDDTTQYDYLTSHRPGARNVPLYFLSRALYTSDIGHTYRTSPVPTLVVHGRSRYTNFDQLPDVLAANDRWQAVSFDSAGDMVHQDVPNMVTAALDEFWSHPALAASD